ncbi:MAG: hypothetical protein JWM68_1151, partial [Verrucomicrobiales bacterium]|nr:hypothetical protein [Verrucomicrobiales bacterium]
FQVDGVVELYGKSAMQTDLNVRTNVNNIPVGRSFEELHLLCCTAGGSPTGKISVVTVHLKYVDGSSNDLAVIFGTHIRQWWGPRHEEDTELLDPRSKPVWSMELAEAAKSDKRSRFFHTVLTNPSPDKVVKTIDLESTKTTAGVLIAGITVGNKNATLLPNTLSSLPPDSDNLERKGEHVSTSGKVLTVPGVAISNGTVRIVGVREIKSSEDALDHPAIGKETKTDGAGHFEFSNLPDNRLYRLLVQSEGLESYVFNGVDPLRGPVEMRLSTARPIQPKEKEFIHGRVLGPDGKPVLGATLEPYGIGLEGGRTSWGGKNGFEDFVVTAASGEFLFERKEPFTRLQLIIHAGGFAPERIWLGASNAIQTVRLTAGAEVAGRILKDGKPLPGLRVGISGSDRNSEVYAGSYEAITDESGRFCFKHLPTTTSWSLYGVIHSFKPHGALHNRSVMTGGDLEQKDLGDLEVEPGLTLSGKIQTHDGQALPNKLKVRLGYDNGGGNSELVSADEGGNFEINGLYSGLVSIYIEPFTWQPTAANRGLDDWNPWSLVGLFEKTKTNLLIVIEKKERNYNNQRWNGNGQLPPADQARSRPLSGAEDSGSMLIRFSGSVLDDDAGQPIQQFAITQGRKPPVSSAAPAAKPMVARIVESIRGKTIPQHERPYWDYARMETFKKGRFDLRMQQLTSTPMLRVEAKDFEPFETEPMFAANTNLVIRLTKGSGPNGIVLLPDGKPANGAQIIFARSGQQFSLNNGKLTTYGEKEQLRETTADGKFSFQANPNGQRLFVSHTNGWANIRLSQFSSGGEIELQPWAVVIGTLVTSNGAPVVNEPMALTMTRDYQRGEASVNVQEHPVTDNKGRFQFLRIPPEAFQLHRMVPVSRGGSTYVYQMPFVALPGKTNDLGKITQDKPPPPSAFDELKRKIGF